jgi:hypothetical protein
MTSSASPREAQPIRENAWGALDSPIRISQLMAAAAIRLLKLQAETRDANLAASRAYLLAPAASGTAGEILGRWSAFVQESGQCAALAARIYFDILGQTQVEAVRLLSGRAPNAGGQMPGAPDMHSAPTPDRRVSATVIGFPDRRVSLAA